MVLPQVSSTCYPKPFAILLDDLRLVSQVLIGFVKPLLRSSRVGPMVMVPEHRVHTEWSLQSREKGPYRVNLGSCRSLVYVVTRADDQITFETIGLVYHVVDDRQWNKETVVEVSEMHDSESRERLGQVWDRDSVMVRQDEISFDEDRVAGQQSRADHTTQPEELSSGHRSIFCGVGFLGRAKPAFCCLSRFLQIELDPLGCFVMPVLLCT